MQIARSGIVHSRHRRWTCRQRPRAPGFSCHRLRLDLPGLERDRRNLYLFATRGVLLSARLPYG